MKINNVKITAFKAERVYKTKTAAIGGVANYEEGIESSDFALIELTTDTGLKGYGEISDIPTSIKMPSGEPFSVWKLEKYLSRYLIGKNPFEIEALLSILPDKNMVDRRPDGTVYDIVTCGVDNAILDLIGKYVGTPVYDLLGGQKKKEVWVSWVVFIRELEFLQQEIQEKIEEGFNAFKLKVGINAEEDEERLRIIRENAGEDAVIKLDANSGWTYEEAVENLKRLEKYNPNGIETPIPYLDVEGKAKLRKEINIPILEHVHTPEFGMELIKNNAVDVFNLSTVGSGGLLNAKKILNIAEAADIPCLLGSTVESGLGTASQLHLASISEQITWPSDLVGPKMYKADNITNPHIWNGSMLQVPKGNGFGMRVNDVN